MIVIASTNGAVGIEEAMRVLKAGGTALDAVEGGIRLVEDNPDDHSVGYSGFPNILGQVELDACLMDGRTLETGAVGAMRGYRYAISVARKVMERLPHVFLVGHGADRFAAEMGFEKSDLLTDEARRIWEKRLKADMPDDVFARLVDQPDLWKWVELATDPERTRGTVNFLARDEQGNIAGGVSTSGWGLEISGPAGRLARHRRRPVRRQSLWGSGLYRHGRDGHSGRDGPQPHLLPQARAFAGRGGPTGHGRPE